jgi:hypothetical protein
MASRVKGRGATAPTQSADRAAFTPSLSTLNGRRNPLIRLFPSASAGTASKLRNHLSPDRNHAHEQHKRGQRSSLFDEHLQHHTLPLFHVEHIKNIVPILFQSQHDLPALSKAAAGVVNRRPIPSCLVAAIVTCVGETDHFDEQLPMGFFSAALTAFKRVTTGETIKQIDTQIADGNCTISLRVKRRKDSEPYVVMAGLAAGNYQYFAMDPAEFDRLADAVQEIRSDLRTNRFRIDSPSS